MLFQPLPGMNSRLPDSLLHPDITTTNTSKRTNKYLFTSLLYAKFASRTR